MNNLDQLRYRNNVILVHEHTLHKFFTVLLVRCPEIAKEMMHQHNLEVNECIDVPAGEHIHYGQKHPPPPLPPDVLLWPTLVKENKL